MAHATTAAPRRHEARVGYRPGLDGLRAVAVLAVIVFHAEPRWLSGGFLGVDIFFVISGYLICQLVLAEHDRSATVSFVGFWGRRARRLLPALYALLIGVTLAALTFARDATEDLFGDVLAALAYVSNWWLIVGNDTYFDTFGRPPLLRHLWSLAVEEQFYLLFPIAMAGLLQIWRRWRTPVAIAAGLGALASTIWMAWLYSAGDDPSRVYYGTDTRAAGLLVGVALGALWSGDRLPHYLPRQQQRLVDWLGVGALVGLAATMFLVHENTTLLFEGGFLVVSLLAALAVAIAVHPASRFGEVLGWAPLLWIGTRSYALYLWHWPVLVLTAPESGDIRGGMPLVFQLAITVALAEASWRFVEQPFRKGTIQRWWVDRDLPVRKGLAVAGGLALVSLGGLLFINRQDEVPTLLADGETRVIPNLPPATTDQGSPVTTAGDPQSTPTDNSTPTTGRAPPIGPVLAIGDSVMLGARDALAQASGGTIAVDAAVSRQVDDGLDVLQDYREGGELDRFSVLVIHLGTNGPFDDDQAQRLTDLIRGLDRVVVVNARVPQSWEDDTNGTVSSLADESNVRIADWYSASAAGGVIEGDGVHPSPSGADVYAQTIIAAVRAFDG